MTTIQLIFGAIFWLLITFIAAAFGARYLPGEWYAQLAKPAWTPPDAVFAPVWFVLYILMATAVWLVWKKYGVSGASGPLAIYVFQLILNGAWSWLFFGMHNPLFALVDIVALWFAILVTLISFWKIVPLAAVLLIPYIAWVSFAAILNWAIWNLNR